MTAKERFTNYLVTLSVARRVYCCGGNVILNKKIIETFSRREERKDEKKIIFG